MIRLRCRRFWRLKHQERDRELLPRESAYLVSHRSACSQCAEEEALGGIALDLLVGASLEPNPSVGFDRRTLRRWRVRRARASAAYWSPAMIGASVAALAVLAALQMLTHSSQLPTLRPKQEQGRNELRAPLILDLQLKPGSTIVR